MGPLVELANTPLGGSLVMALVTVWPLARCFRRAGRSGFWAILVFVPLLGLPIVLGALSLLRWPAVRVGGLAHPQLPTSGAPADAAQKSGG